MPQRPSRSEERLARQRFTGGRIRRAREEVGLSQRELSQRLGFTHTWLSNVELGANSIDVHDLQAVARELGYPIDWFTDPNFDAASFRRPRTKVEWETAYQGMPDLARLHWELDQAMAHAREGAERRGENPS